MAGKVKRSKTKYTSIYKNETTDKYDIKFNYSEYSPKEQKNVYKSKWVYGIETITEARQELAKLQAGGVKAKDKDITLAGAFELWEIKAKAQDFSPITIRNTEDHLKMIYQFLPASTRLKDIDENVYLKFCADIRAHGYAEETLYSINSTFRKLINLAYKKRLISENFLTYADNMKTKQKEDYKTITPEDFDTLDGYFKNSSFVRLGVDNYPKYRLMLNILYYTGARIGEVLALTYNDFEEFSYYRKNETPPIRIAPTAPKEEEAHLQGLRVRISKAYVSEIKLTKSPKNFKKRTVPLYQQAEYLFLKEKNKHLQRGGSLEDRLFPWTHGAAIEAIKKGCEKNNLTRYTCHDFRHTFISNLIRRGVPLPVIEKVSGDTQETILKRYSHMFETDEVLVLSALQDL